MKNLIKIIICLTVLLITVIESTLSLAVPMSYENDTSNTETYFMTDGKSNTMTLNHSRPTSGLIVKQTTAYHAYGKQNQSLSSNVNTSFTYDGEYQDPATNLVYLRDRDYDLLLQRFTTMDSYHVWNKYNFADANPIMNIDPSGHHSHSFYEFMTSGLLTLMAMLSLNAIAMYYGGAELLSLSAGTVATEATDATGAAAGAEAATGQTINPSLARLLPCMMTRQTELKTGLVAEVFSSAGAIMDYVRYVNPRTPSWVGKVGMGLEFGVGLYAFGAMKVVRAYDFLETSRPNNLLFRGARRIYRPLEIVRNRIVPTRYLSSTHGILKSVALGTIYGVTKYVPFLFLQMGVYFPLRLFGKSPNWL